VAPKVMLDARLARRPWLAAASEAPRRARRRARRAIAANKRDFDARFELAQRTSPRSASPRRWTSCSKS
jgi:putative thioredoxin